MRRDIVAIANRLIPQPKNVELINSDFVTVDIIKQVLSQFEKHKDQLQAFAPHLKGATVKETCYNIWRFWLSDKDPAKAGKRINILYQEDNAGARQQLVKSPAALWADKFGDCKSLSVAVMCSLYALGIKSVFRFVSFNRDTKTIPKHVYIVAHDQEREIIIDCCLPEFDMQNPYAAKYDYLPAGLYAVNGVGEPRIYSKLRAAGFMRVRPPKSKFLEVIKKKRGEFNLSGVETEAEMDLLIREHQLELEQQKAAQLHGIGSVADNNYEIELAAINNAICDIGNSRLKRLQGRTYRRLVPRQNGSPVIPSAREIDVYIAGKKSEKKAAKKAKKTEKKTQKALKKNEKGKGLNKKQQKLVEKTGAVVKKKKEGILKKVAKGIVKVVTAPVRLLAKGVLEVMLPKSAPVFLYLFLDEKLLAKAPAAVKQKRAMAASVAEKIINKIGMKRDHFMGILRNGIMKNLGDTPENVIAQWIKDANYQVGLLPALAAAGKIALDLGKKIVGSKIEDLQNNAPDPSDWITESAAARQEMATEVQQQPTNNDPAINPSVPTTQAYQPSNTYYTPGNTPATDSSLNTSYNSNYQGTPPPIDHTGDNRENFGDKNYEGKEEENVTVKSVKTKSDGNNTGLIIAAVAVAALALSGKKKRA